MENLPPAEIKLDIFSRLSAESVLQCRQVCKTCRALLHYPHYGEYDENGEVGILYLNGKVDDEEYLYYGEYDENDELSYRTLTRINRPPIKVSSRVFESCNGLVCLSVDNNDDHNDSICICHPITSDYIILPLYNIDISEERYTIRGIVYGLGYLPSTNECTVGILYFCDRKKRLSSKLVLVSVQVHTLGAGTGWRKEENLLNLHHGMCAC